MKGKLAGNYPVEIDDNNMVYIAIDSKIYIIQIKKIIKEKPIVKYCIDME